MDTSSDDHIVISGIAGRYPKSLNVKEFEHNLFNKIDMIDDDDSRWEYFNEEVPKRFGKVGNLEKFDASFFSILSKHANWTDPQIRLLLEHAYECILDAGVSPQSLVGSRTGVFIGNSETDSKDVFSYQIPTREGYGMQGNAGFYLANRISYILGLEGPSLRIDSACSSTAYALNHAFESIKNGSCDAALVGGSNLMMSFLTTTEFFKGKILSPNGMCRPFDESSNGFTRAEAIGMVFLQKQHNAKRIYATVIASGVNNDGFKEQGASFPSRHMQEKLIRDIFTKSTVRPNEIGFIEAHATGTVGDSEEVAAIDAVFNENRNGSLLIGSVKSNMGHAEAASAFASLSKLIISFECDKVAPNIYYSQPRADIEAIRDGRIKVATEGEEMKSDYAAMNSFGLGGANAHILFKRNTKIKSNSGMPSDYLDRLVLWSARTDEAIKTVFDAITKNPLDVEFISLLQSSQIKTNYGNTVRGYGLFRHNEATNKAECVQHHLHNFNGKRQQIVWVYNGIGSQWPQMGADLMKIPTFADSINKSHEILLAKGVDLKKILTSSDKEIFANVLHSYVGIIAIEIAITDVLKSLGLSPDFVIGHSVGEMGCAYADGCFTAEEAILVSYERGMANNESKNIKGAMAAVGMNYKDIVNLLPQDVDIACHNSIDSTTITGPCESIARVVEKLKSEGVFVKEVQSSGIALHSRYLNDFKEKFYARLKNVIKNPKKRSERWLSTAYAKDDWVKSESQYSSAEYHVKNLVSTVLFEEVMAILPNEVITVEIGPHSLLKALLKRSLKEGTHVSLTQRDNLDGTKFFLNSLGSLFEYGVDMDIAKIYPAIDYPVSRGTPMISPLIKWSHQENFTVPVIDRSQYYQRRNVAISLNDKNYSFIQDHIIDGRILIPGTVLVALVWETFNLMYGNLHSHMKVMFEEVKLTRITFLEKNQDINLCVNINRGSGYFEVTEKSSILAQGYIRKISEYLPMEITPEERENSTMLCEADFYKEMRLRGYHHQGIFRGVKKIRNDGLVGEVQWNNNWSTFLDALLQIFILMDDTRALVLPTYFGKIILDPEQHSKALDEISGEEKIFKFYGDYETKTIIIPGVEIHYFDGNEISRRREASKPVIESYKFISNFSDATFTKRDVAKICVQLTLERLLTPNFKCVEVNEVDGEYLSPFMHLALKDVPAMKFGVTLLTSKTVESVDNVEIVDGELSSYTDVDMIISRNCVMNENFINSARNSLKSTGILVSHESQKLDNEHKNFNGFKIIAKYQLIDGDFIYILTEFKKHENDQKIVKISSNISKWLEPLKEVLKDENSSVIAYSQGENVSGILGLVNCIRRENIGKRLRCVFIDDERAPKFNLDNSFYRTQLDLGFPVNVFKNGNWGTYRHVEMHQEFKEQPQYGDCYVRCLNKGDFSSLTWVQGSNIPETPQSIRVNCSSLNFKDLMLALGRITPNIQMSRIEELRILGIDWSGTTHDGKRLMGIGTAQGLSTYLQANMMTTWEIPDNWTFEEAATIPLVYFTVYLAFFHHSKIRSGKKILIHSGAGGVGQAAINIATAYGLEIFTTIGNEEKRNYLLKKFPQLNPENIGNSRDLSFERMIMKNTKGKGVDYVLNSLSGDKLQASIRCLAKNGVFMEIGKFDMMNRSKIDMRHFAKDIAFVSMFAENLLCIPSAVGIYAQMGEDLKNGIIKPLDYKIFKPTEIEDAFRFMQTGKHIGKVLIKLRENDKDIVSAPIKINPNIHCFDYESYVIIGGLGGFGLELADFLVMRGCKNLILSSSRGLTSSYQAYRISTWESYGAKVKISTANAATKEGCRELLNEAQKLGIVSGIFNLAVALRDAPFEEQTVESFEQSLSPKATITKNLDELSREMCPKLRYFVIFSSISCGRGNLSQSNYGMANSIMERIIEQRHKCGLPAKAIQWGAIGGVGLLANLLERNITLNIGGTLPQSISSCLEVLDSLVTSDDPIVESMIVAKSVHGDGKKGNFIETMLNILGISDRKKLSMDTSLSKLGIDSLIAVEIQQVLERDYDILYSAQELRSLTLRELEKRVLLKGSHGDDSKKDVVDIRNLMVSQIGDEKIKDEIIVKINTHSIDTSVKALIIPGFEGMNNESINSVAENLHCPAYVLQISKPYDATSLQDILAVIWNDIIDLYTNSEKFLIISYSFGTLLGLKIANILESLDKVGSLVMIDGSPEFVKKLSHTLLSDVMDDDEKIRQRVLGMCIKSMEPSISEAAIIDILQQKTFDEKYVKFTEISENQIAFSKNFIREFSVALFNRSKISLDVDESSLPTLQRTPISLIKSSETSLSDMSENYGLDKFSTQNVTTHTVEGNHQTILKNSNLIKLLNDSVTALKNN